MSRKFQKIAILYPPFKKGGDYPLLSQNRHLKWSSSQEVRIFPVLLATMATNFKNKSYDVLWLDGINERMEMPGFETQVSDFKPDMIIMETKAPVIKMHWDYSEHLKKLLPDTKIALFGDHVSHLPEETFDHTSAVDYTIAGGYFDFIAPELADYLNGEGEMPGSVYWKNSNSGPQKEYDLKDTPLIDYKLAKWHIYHEAYLHHPAAYIMSGRGCGASRGRSGVCTYCVWQYNFWKLKHALRPVEQVVDEIEMLVKKLKVREIFDDNESSFFYDREWTKRFCDEMHKRKLAGKVILSANCRSDHMDYELCKMIKKAGFRLLKIGVEAGNDETLKKICKLEKMETMYQGIYNAKKAGLNVMLTNMIGYPWQDEEEVREQYKEVKKLMLYKTRFGDSMQASVVVPYPGTPLFKQAQKNDWFIVDVSNYENLDMDTPVLKHKFDTTYWCRKMWKVQFHPWFLFKSFITLRSFHDIKLAWTGVKSLLGHIKDYVLKEGPEQGRFRKDKDVDVKAKV